jgi:hypothetical protein
MSFVIEFLGNCENQQHVRGGKGKGMIVVDRDRIVTA